MLGLTSLTAARALWAAVAVFIIYPILRVIYNLTLHPLAKFKNGPILWRCSRLPYCVSAWNGLLSRDVQALHAKYGPIIRIAPNELSIADPQAYEDIYSNLGASLAFPKTPIWHAPPPGKPLMLINAIDRDVHGKMRRKMEPSFTERAVARQEAIPQQYMSLLIKKLKEAIKRSGQNETIVDIVPWLTYLTIDLIGDLAFGESFGCLETGEHDDWLGFTFNSIRAMWYIVLLRHYGWLHNLLMGMIPKSVQKQADDHWDTMENKVKRRMARNTTRPDFITLWLEEGKKGAEPLPHGEIYANAFLISIAGSDTVSTTLFGTINRLVKAPHVIEKLTEELRTRFSKAEDITFSALKELPYLHAVMREGMRMCDPVPISNVRQTPPEGGTVCGEFVPGNTIVSVNSKRMCSDPERWHEPTVFHPERWLPEATLPSSLFYNDNRSIVEIFSIGPRSCIGKPLALAEMRMVLGRLFWEFDIRKADTKAGNLVWEDQKAYSVVQKEPFEINIALRSN
ncbi:cytochrome P450 [Lophiotrema nucula]|uniref:Cytochrome P450 n=1 Tax=Lophiotrema nucula TaxID=690887 RepID=A0A6A5YNC8_9PLEO|nr:cytochrome P450 [Lophiotrema nucula]